MSCAKFNRNHFDTRNPTKLIIVKKKTVPDYNEKCELYYVKFNMCTVMYSVCLFFSTLPTGKKVRKTRISSRIPTRIACDWAPRLWHTSKPRVWSLKTGLNVGGEDMQFTNWWMDAMMIIRDDTWWYYYIWRPDDLWSWCMMIDDDKWWWKKYTCYYII